jgi:hypothetical protein
VPRCPVAIIVAIHPGKTIWHQPKAGKNYIENRERQQNVGQQDAQQLCISGCKDIRPAGNWVIIRSGAYVALAQLLRYEVNC